MTGASARFAGTALAAQPADNACLPRPANEVPSLQL